MNKFLTIRRITRKGFDYAVSGTLVAYLVAFVVQVSQLVAA